MKFKENHSGYNYSDSKYSNQYSKLVIEVIHGIRNNNIEKEENSK